MGKTVFKQSSTGKLAIKHDSLKWESKLQRDFTVKYARLHIEEARIKLYRGEVFHGGCRLIWQIRDLQEWTLVCSQLPNPSQ